MCPGTEQRTQNLHLTRNHCPFWLAVGREVEPIRYLASYISATGITLWLSKLCEEMQYSDTMRKSDVQCCEI
jgi:hypothetical protein